MPGTTQGVVPSIDGGNSTFSGQCRTQLVSPVKAIGLIRNRPFGGRGRPNKGTPTSSLSADVSDWLQGRRSPLPGLN